MTWTPDMVSRIASDRIQRIPAPRQIVIPEGVDELMERFIERYYYLRIWHNRDLQVFSTPGETLEEFIQRCRDLLQPQRTEKMRNVSEVMHHRFFQLYRRAVGATQEEDLPDRMAVRMKAELETVFAGGKDDLTRLFLRDDTSNDGELGHDWRVEFLPQIQERLDDFRIRLLNRYNEVVSDFEERACKVEPFQIPANRRSIDILSRDVVWE